MVEGRTHRMTEMIARLAPGATVDQARAEVAAVHARIRTTVQGRLRPGLALPGRGHPVPAGARRAGAADAVAAHGCGGVRPDHLGGERREPHADARRAPGARAGGARRARRRAVGCGGCCWSRTCCSRWWGPVGARRRARRASSCWSARRPVLAARRPRSSSMARCSGFTLGSRSRWRCCSRSSASLPQGGRFACAGSRPARTGSPAAPGKQRLQRGLVVAQIAVSVVLLAGAGLLTRTMMRAVRGGHRSSDRGGPDDAGAVARRPIPPPRPTPKQALTSEMRGRDPGDSGRGGRGPWLDVPLPTSPSSTSSSRPRGSRCRSARRCRAPKAVPPIPNYFRAAGIPLLRGREFTITDRKGRARSRSSTRRWPTRSSPTRIRSGSASPGRATSCDSLPSTGTGAPSSAWSATPRTAGSTRRHPPSCSCRSRRSSTMPAGS